jgi:hypothetical protein
MTHILGIDPGLATGVAVLKVDDPAAPVLVNSNELEFTGVGEWLDLWLDALTDDPYIVIERFTITPQTHKNSQAPWSLEVIGMARWIASRYGAEDRIFMQAPGDAKSFMPNEKLKAAGLWHRGGEGHALDGIRHAVTFGVKRKFIDPRMFLT